MRGGHDFGADAVAVGDGDDGGLIEGVSESYMESVPENVLWNSTTSMHIAHCG